MKTVKFRNGAKEFVVGKILCLGRNYAEHISEMNAATPSVPVVFIKPSTALIQENEYVIKPLIAKELHHEVEMVVLIGRKAKDVKEGTALDYIAGYGVGLDMTLRDIQTQAKQNGEPWSIAKGFDTSAPISQFAERESIPDPHALGISLKVNGVIRQQSNTGKMIFRLEYLLSFLSSIFTLDPGDLIFTGTPEGVGPVFSGDTLEAELESVGKLKVMIQ
jgi:2-keto-4-pentenoate hydratase/2-oxohepta-3-ene-1,7-dioic acid hydratase in catechol pathway